MSTRPPLIEISEDDRRKLRSWAKSRTMQKQMVERAKMVLACAEGRPVKEIAEDFGTYPNKVIFWRQRYQAEGVKISQRSKLPINREPCPTHRPMKCYNSTSKPFKWRKREVTGSNLEIL